MKKIISVLLAACVLCGAGAVSAFEAIQSTDTNNIYIEGKLEEDITGEITLHLYNGGETCYISEITPDADGSYSTKFLYKGNASDLSFDLRVGGTKINDTVISAVSGTDRLIEANVYLTDENGGSLMIGKTIKREPHIIGKFTYQPTNEISKDTSAGVTVYPKNKLGADNTKYSVLLAQYNQSGALVKCDTLKSDALDFSDYSGKNAINCGTVELAADTASAKAFMWESETSLMPYEPAANGELEKINLWLIGDSTWQDWPEKYFPQGGVGSYLGDYFNSDNITVINKGVSGSKASTWLDDDPALGNWSGFIPLVRSGDYVIICLGINDLCASQDANTVNTYRECISEMVRQVKDKNATPVLISPILNAYKGTDGKVTFSNYLKVAGENLADIAEKEGLVYLPLSERSYEIFKDNTADEQCRLYHLSYDELSNWGLTDDEIKNNPSSILRNGGNDEMHTNVRGADKFASIICQLLSESGSELKHYLK